MSSKNRRPQQPAAQPPIRIGRVTIRDGALDLDPDFAAEVRDAVAREDRHLARALGSLMSLEDLDSAAVRCAKYLEQAMAKGDAPACERFASLLFAIDVTAKAHGDEIRRCWPPARTATEAIERAPVGEGGLVGPDDAVQADVDQSEAPIAMTWNGQPIGVHPASGEFESTFPPPVDEEAEAAAAAELAAQREELVRGRNG